MEEIEVTSWITLDALKKAAKVVEAVGNLQVGHSLSVFCIIEQDYFELSYSDAAANFIRRYEDKDEFQEALDQRKEEDGEAPYDEDLDYEEDDKDEEEEEFDVEEESEDY